MRLRKFSCCLIGFFLCCFLFRMGMVYAGCEEGYGDACRFSSVQIGANYTRANLKVDGQSSFKGNLGGMQGSYEYHPWNSLYAGAKVAWKQGTTKNSSASRKLVYIDAQERIGYTYAPCCNWSATLFSGLGYRYLNHKLSQSESSSIKFKYNEFYTPLGVLSEYFFCSCWSVGLNAIWMPQIYSTVEIVPLKGARWILTKTVGNVLVELPITYYFNGCYSVVFKPFYERWEDGRSTAETSSGQSLGLPKNFYNFWGAELNFAFAF